MKKRILIILVIVYFVVFIVFSFFIKKKYIIFDDIIFKVSGNSFISQSSYPLGINDKNANIFVNNFNINGYVNLKNGNIFYYDDSFKKINDITVACIDCKLDIVDLDKIGIDTLSSEDKDIIKKFFDNHFREFGTEMKYSKKIIYDFNNDGQKESLYLISNLFDSNELKNHSYKDNLDGDYYEVAFIYDNNKYQTVLKKDISDSSTEIYDLAYFFKVDYSNSNYYFRVYDYYDTDYYCGSVFSEDNNDYIEEISCQENRGDYNE